MKVIFNFEFIRANFLFFIILMIILLCIIVSAFYLASKEVKNDRN